MAGCDPHYAGYAVTVLIDDVARARGDGGMLSLHGWVQVRTARVGHGMLDADTRSPGVRMNPERGWRTHESGA